MKHLADGAFCIPYNQDRSEILLTLRKDSHFWFPTGGGIEGDETPEDAVIREVKEETGLDFQVEQYHGIYIVRLINKVESKVYLYSGMVNDGKITLDPDEVIKARYFKPSRLPFRLCPHTKDWIYTAENHITLKDPKIQELGYPTLAYYVLRNPMLLAYYKKLGRTAKD